MQVDDDTEAPPLVPDPVQMVTDLRRDIDALVRNIDNKLVALSRDIVRLDNAVSNDGDPVKLPTIEVLQCVADAVSCTLRRTLLAPSAPPAPTCAPSTPRTCLSWQSSGERSRP
jgi:hypothetical protein